MKLRNQAERLGYILTECQKDGVTVLVGMASNKRHTEMWCLPKLNLNNPTNSYFITQATVDHILYLRKNGGLIYVVRTPYEIELEHYLLKWHLIRNTWHRVYCLRHNVIYKNDTSNYKFVSKQFWEYTKHLYEGIDMPLETINSMVYKLLEMVFKGNTYLIEDIFKTTFHYGQTIAKLYRIFLENKPLILPFLREG